MNFCCFQAVLSTPGPISVHAFVYAVVWGVLCLIHFHSPSLHQRVPSSLPVCGKVESLFPLDVHWAQLDSHLWLQLRKIKKYSCCSSCYLRSSSCRTEVCVHRHLSAGLYFKRLHIASHSPELSLHTLPPVFLKQQLTHYSWRHSTSFWLMTQSLTPLFTLVSPPNTTFTGCRKLQPFVLEKPYSLSEKNEKVLCVWSKAFIILNTSSHCLPFLLLFF